MKAKIKVKSEITTTTMLLWVSLPGSLHTALHSSVGEELNHVSCFYGEAQPIVLQTFSLALSLTISSRSPLQALSEISASSIYKFKCA